MTHAVIGNLFQTRSDSHNFFDTLSILHIAWVIILLRGLLQVINCHIFEYVTI